MGLTESGYLSTLTNLTLIILFSEMLKFSKINSSKSKNIVKDNSEYFGIFYLLKRIFQNQLIIRQTSVEMAKVLQHMSDKKVEIF
jgi:hypothetical protein